MPEKTDRTILENVNIFMSKISELNTDSLSEATSSSRLTPMVLIDQSLTMGDSKVLTNALQTITGIYTAHYLQAIQMANVKDVHTVQLLDQFATNRTLGKSGALMNGNLSGIPLPVGLENTDALEMYDTVHAMEARKNDLALDDHVNLAVGRQITVSIGAGERTLDIDVTVQINPKIIPSDALPKVLASVVKDRSYLGRYHQWRAGEIESFLDYALALDLIESDRNALLNDTTGIIREASRQKSKGWFMTFMSGRKSMNTASQMAVISSSIVDDMELALGGKLKNHRNIQQYFVSTHSMLLMVLDMRKETVRIFQRGISGHGQYTFRDIEKVSKSANGMDIESVMQAYKMGDSARF